MDTFFTVTLPDAEYKRLKGGKLTKLRKQFSETANKRLKLNEERLFYAGICPTLELLLEER